ncbi:bifunctional glycosyltransferase family 2/GtrA family protein [Legionella hackeliae]|uniref:Dolichyl-phosphate beta-glucosyltransferase n=1 Tax=Legionella hackeliae TaxID=449 RepID=A0A0A8UQF9_LEGHA|nr:bifunctional glycosyltransferase family 2/GtrA family protein [Legionella hackeliae]KTD13484.1 glycosyltransferase [Legionella hackeliae]CEK09327.1 Dolichyl-phosphate beta-glucosyltransferase [Legionella hackeliae]STX49232.1 glycosyltransferase [Legionella hackeliae]
MPSKNYPVLIIPAYNPDERLSQLLKEHSELCSEQKCIIVNDGSTAESMKIFNQLESDGYIVLHHKRNQGKGAALKTAMNYYLAVFSQEMTGVITADADGQHSVEDIIHLSQRFHEEPSKLYLGVRQIAKGDIPLRSRFGNVLTKLLFNVLTRSRIKDTQTGLRGIPNQLIRSLVMTTTKRYEFEFEMFFIAKKLRLQIEQLPIETIYIDNNKGSHFNPLVDSLRIYYIFLRFCSVAIFSFLLDFSLFSMFYLISQHAAFAVFGARLISAPVNFILNKNLSFKSQKSLLVSAFQYFTLVVVMGASSFYVMNFIHYTGLNIYFSKIIAEFLIFMANFLIQYLVIFTKRTNLISLNA